MIWSISPFRGGGELLTEQEIAKLYAVDPYSKEAAVIQWAAYEISQKVSGGKAEVHAQLGLDASPCSKDCKFCSFAAGNGIRKEKFELSMDEILKFAYTAAEEQVGYVLYLTTADYEFEKILEAVERTKEAIGKNYPVLTCTGDMTCEQFKQLKAAGANGIYHALRLGEGIDTTISPQTRKQTIEIAHSIGLKHCTTMEPIGPEHTPEQLAELTTYIRSTNPVYGGAWRRGELCCTSRPMNTINESVLAHYTSVFRIAASQNMHTMLSANSTLLARCGANAVCAELGANPRDDALLTEEGCGLSISEAKRIFKESGWELAEGPVKEWLEDYVG